MRRVNEGFLTGVDWKVNCGRMKMKTWGLFFLALSLGPLGAWAQPAKEKEVKVVVNRVMAVVGGSRVITLQDVQSFRISGMHRANAMQMGLEEDTNELALGELINNALLIHEIRNRKGFVMPAGLGERLVADYLRREDMNRGTLLKELQSIGITLEQFENNLVDRALLQVNMEPYRREVQVSPEAVRTYFKGNPQKFDLGIFVDMQAIQIPADEDGINEESIKAMVAGIESMEDFSKLAVERKVANEGVQARIYANNEATHYGGVDLSAFLIDETTPVGKGVVLKQGNIYHVMFIKERGEEQKRKLGDPRVQKDIKMTLQSRQYYKRLNLKLERLRQTINVYVPGVKD